MSASVRLLWPFVTSGDRVMDFVQYTSRLPSWKPQVKPQGLSGVSCCMSTVIVSTTLFFRRNNFKMQEVVRRSLYLSTHAPQPFLPNMLITIWVAVAKNSKKSDLIKLRKVSYFFFKRESPAGRVCEQILTSLQVQIFRPSLLFVSIMVMV